MGYVLIVGGHHSMSTPTGPFNYYQYPNFEFPFSDDPATKANLEFGRITLKPDPPSSSTEGGS